ncbi:hypothetical protein [Paenibacillus sp. Leaf72]|uniref:hypothetical protein n=1 Tax=Paenibacillus sp. Leaf72 TaxID=1736234 RepID=UPI0006F7BF37|nr:hypothetical protein [Paenibacillus sp. Leaf72]KQO18367.1 hypothetical protein ASF12_07050 [Paenibacillus sp. Leaf72]
MEGHRLCWNRRYAGTHSGAYRDVGAQLKHMGSVADHGGQVVYVAGAEHYNFADVQFLTPILRQIGMTGKRSTDRVASIINAYTLSFFDHYLKNKGDSLLEGPSEAYPEVKFMTSLFAGGNGEESEKRERQEP